MEKLRSIGSIVGTPRKVETIYKIGYATDEQAYTVDGVHRRIGDIAGYPLYVA